MTSRCMPGILVAFIVTARVASVGADDWPQFRGQNRDGVSAEKGLLQKWPEGGPTKLWTTSELGGTNGSSVAVAEGTIYGIGSDRGKPTLWALEEQSGKLKWATPISEKSAAGGHSTPTFAKGKVYALSEKGDLACVDATQGTVVWRKSYVDDFGGRPSGFGGYSESVLVDDGAVICTPGSTDAAIVALKADTGEVIWKTAIPEGRPHWVYCSPMKAKVGEVPMYITLLAGSQGGVTAVHAKTGKVLWQYKQVYEGPYPIPNPVIKDDKVVVSTFGGWAVLQMSADSSQDVTVKEIKRHKRDDLSCYWGGMTPVGDYIYFAHTQRPPEGYQPFLPVCVSWQGDIQWKAKEAPGGKLHEGSAGCISANGMLYFLYEDGTAALVKADPTQYTLVSRFTVPRTRKEMRGHPAIANGRLYVLHSGELHCYDIRAGVK